MPRIGTGVVSRVVWVGVLCLASALGGGYAYYRHLESSVQRRLEAENARLREREAELQALIERMRRTRRLAQVVVTRQEERPDGSVETELLFVELDENGKAVGRRTFILPGDVAFFDGLTIKFTPEAFGTVHPVRGESLVLLRRVYSEEMSPRDGFPIDEPGRIPAAYGTGKAPGELETRLWSKFWQMASDPQLAAEHGVRVAQGEAVYKPMRPGVLYELTIDAIGGLNIEAKPMPEAVEMLLGEA